MKIATWNINGIRSLKKSIDCILSELSSDVVCFQETKVSRGQLQESTALINSYTSYFSYPRKQSGYSGVATYCSDSFTPEDAQEGLSGVLASGNCDCLQNFPSDFEPSLSDLIELDSEGRVIITYHLIKYNDEIRRLAIINVYCPRVDPDKPERQLYKMQFCFLLEAKTKELCSNGCCVVIVGDMNIACCPIDHCDPGDEKEFNASEARQWLKCFLSNPINSIDGSICIVDAFRHFYPDKKEAYTCWNVKTGARLTNYGTRIDYILLSSNLLPLLENCDILSDYDGSDHCPVTAVLKCDSISEKSVQLPSICTRLWPEFCGRQQTLQSFLQKVQNTADQVTNINDSKVQSLPSKNKLLQRKSAQKSIKSFFTVKSNSPDNNTTSKTDEAAIEQSDQNADKEAASSDSFESDSLGTEYGEISSSPRLNQASEWKSVFRGPPKPPLCSGHSKECVLRTVKKKGPNCGRQFFMCAQPAGHPSNPDANCNFFKWVSAPKFNVLKKS